MNLYPILRASLGLLRARPCCWLTIGKGNPWAKREGPHLTTVQSLELY